MNENMSVPAFPDFGKWSAEELKKAETAAVEFVNQNSTGIAQTFEKRLLILAKVVARLKAPGISFDERMLCLSVVEELSKGLSESARGFFEIGYVPSVAKLMKP